MSSEAPIEIASNTDLLWVIMVSTHLPGPPRAIRRA